MFYPLLPAGAARVAIAWAVRPFGASIKTVAGPKSCDISGQCGRESVDGVDGRRGHPIDEGGAFPDASRPPDDRVSAALATAQAAARPAEPHPDAAPAII